ncbi:GDP-mannose 4,6-dehydratase [Spongiivirga sp. MCCC 1A20706]|uniref:GDP-mannose 4,6-dehydratase n=1 Tax=Spongiivirga sp. MCCC 1A20706 TaxID=3160963 RepID=UPI00397774DA
MAAPSNKKVFITGIGGFTGFHLEKEMTSLGYEVYGSTFTKPNKKNHFRCDILKKKEFATIIGEMKPDFLIHLAAISFVASEDISQIYNTNVIGTLSIFEVLEELNIAPKKIIIVSSAAVYGNIGTILSEDMCPKPVNHYGNSKLVMENMVANYFKKFNVIITRPFNYTGERQESNFLVPKIVKHFIEKKPFIELGNLDTFREYNNVKFLTKTYIKLLNSEFKSGVVNIATGSTYAIQNILDNLEKISGHKIEVRVNKKFVRKNEIKELKGSTDKLVKLVGFDKQNLTLESTLKEMYYSK